MLIKKQTYVKAEKCNSILEAFEYFCQISSKLILIILRYSVSSAFFWDSVYKLISICIFSLCLWQGVQWLELGAGRGTSHRRSARCVDLYGRCRSAPASPWTTSDVIVTRRWQRRRYKQNTTALGPTFTAYTTAYSAKRRHQSSERMILDQPHQIASFSVRILTVGFQVVLDCLYLRYNIVRGRPLPLVSSGGGSCMIFLASVSSGNRAMWSNMEKCRARQYS